MKKLKIGIIGCGAMGSEIALSCQNNLSGRVEVFAICDIDPAKMAALNGRLKRKARPLGLSDIIEKSDFIIEAASAKISAGILSECIKMRRDCLLMSVGGLLGNESLLSRAESRGIKVYIPSGALCGIDGLKSASIGKIESVTLTTRKPPKGLIGAPYLKRKGIDLGKIKEETVIFEGSALDAVKAFPQNVNVSAVLSLAGIGAKKTRVRVVTSPGYTKNMHEVEVTGSFGRIFAKTENVPSKANPKTSALAIFSALSMLEGLTKNIRIGN